MTHSGDTIAHIGPRIDRLNHVKRELTLQVEDLRAQLYSALDMQVAATQQAAKLAHEYGMAIREIHALEADLENVRFERDQAPEIERANMRVELAYTRAKASR